MTVKYRDEPAALSDVCLFSSFSFCGIVEEYVYYYLQELKKAGLAIVFISTSPLKDTCINRLSEYSFLVIERENKCPDFGSWKAGLSLLDWGRNLNSVLLANDSVFGPFFNIGDIILSMKKKYDVWGMTENHEIEFHLQSYFLYFNQKAVNNEIFSDFWRQVDLSAIKNEVIQRYEVGLSTIFRKNNFSLGAYVGIKTLGQNEHLDHNPTLVFWKTLVEKFQFPFMKRELLIKADIAKTYWTINLYISTSGWRKTIGGHTAYPTTYIEQFLVNYEAFLQSHNNPVSLKKRKILFLSHSTANGEGQRLLINFLQWLRKETDIEAEIIICNKSDGGTENELAELGVVTHFYGLTTPGKQQLKHRVAEEIALVFSFSIKDIPIQKFLFISNIPQLLFVQESKDILNDIFSQDKRSWLLSNTQLLIAGSTTTQNHLRELGIPPGKTEVIYKFIHANVSSDTEKKQAAIKVQLNIPANAFLVGVSGESKMKKSTELLPVIATALCSEHNDIHIIWLDSTTSAQDAVYLELAQTGLNERVHLVDNGLERRNYFEAIDLFVMVNRDDAFSLITLESGFAGTPVICFTGSENADEYIGFGTGYAVPYLNIGKLSERVFDYYNNRTRLATEKKSIAETVRKNFTTTIQAPKILQLIRNYYDEKELMLKEEPPVTFFTHIYYENSWDEIRNKLKNFENAKNNFLFSISDACIAKEQIIEDIKRTFKKSYSLVTSNIGKDIGGKMALIDIYLLLNIPSSYIVFLHDKQSPHSIQGESWKNGLFKIVDYNNQKMIISLFKDHSVGIVGSKDHIINEYDLVTETFINNSNLSKKLLTQFDMSIENYDFLGGTMYWIRSGIIEKFFKKNNPILMRENLEAGNVIDLYGERLAHTWERMFSWMATNQGFSIKGI